MKRLFIILPFLCLSTLTVSAEQETTSTAFIANPDGTSTLRVIEPGKEPVVYSISQGGTNVLMKIGLEEPMFAEMQGNMTSQRFHGSDEEVAVYQEALGMTAEQVTRMAKLRADSMENFREFERPFLEGLTRFDELTPDEAESFENVARLTFQGCIAVEQAVLAEVLTPAQLQRVQELELVLPTQTLPTLGDEKAEPFLNLKAYETLELSEEQKEALAKMWQEFGKEVADVYQNMLKDVIKMAADGNEPSKEMLKPYLEKTSALKARIKARTLSLLTAEQTAKLEKILADWPAKLEQIRADWKLKQANKRPEDDSWRDAWKPGDPVPEGAVPPKIRKPFPF